MADGGRIHIVLEREREREREKFAIHCAQLHTLRGSVLICLEFKRWKKKKRRRWGRLVVAAWLTVAPGRCGDDDDALSV